MRIRSTLTGLAVAAGVLLLSAPAALADQQPTAPQTPTVTTSRPTPPATATTLRPAAPTARPAERQPQVVKPRGAAETGGGGTADAQGLYAIGGAALVLTGGVGTLAYRRLRKQG